MRPTRRALLGAAAVAIGLPAITFMGLRRFDSAEEVIVAYLRRELPGLAVSDGQMRGFADEHVCRRFSAGGKSATVQNQLVLAAMNLDQSTVRSLPESALAPYIYHTRELMTTFLFSTDFFGPAGRMPGRTQFIAYADPYALGCRNPLAGFGMG